MKNSENRLLCTWIKTELLAEVNFTKNAFDDIETLKAEILTYGYTFTQNTLGEYTLSYGDKVVSAIKFPVNF